MFQLIDHITLNCCYKIFRSLQTYPIGLQRQKAKITTSFEPLKNFINEHLKVSFQYLVQP